MIADKGIKAAMINIFTELKEGIMIISHQRDNIKKEEEIIKEKQMEILKLQIQ